MKWRRKQTAPRNSSDSALVVSYPDSSNYNAKPSQIPEADYLTRILPAATLSIAHLTAAQATLTTLSSILYNNSHSMQPVKRTKLSNFNATNKSTLVTKRNYLRLCACDLNKEHELGKTAGLFRFLFLFRMSGHRRAALMDDLSVFSFFALGS